MRVKQEDHPLPLVPSHKGRGIQWLEVLLIKEIDLCAAEGIIKKYTDGVSDLIPVLQDVQEAYGYIPEPVVYVIAEGLNIYPSHIFGVITFYAQFKLKPAGKYIVKVCTGTACHVKGSERISKEIKELLKVKVGDTTGDGRFTFEEVACVGACAQAPMVIVGGNEYGKVTHTEAKKIVKKYQKG